LKLAPGPGNWIRPVELQHLQHRYAHPFSFASFEHLALAAKLRVIEYEPQLQLNIKLSALQGAFRTARIRRPEWQNWYNQSHLFVLDRARNACADRGLTVSSVHSELRKKTPTRQQATYNIFIKHHFQACALTQLLHNEPYNHEHHLREKLVNWKIAAPPVGILARRALRTLDKAFELVSVRVAVVLFRTWQNGWCTASRFQDHQARCLFSCTSSCSEDSIHHYAHCPVVLEFAQRRLNMTQRPT